METVKSKICAVALLIAGVIPIITDGDATAFVFLACFAVPMLFIKSNWIS